MVKSEFTLTRPSKAITLLLRLLLRLISLYQDFCLGCNSLSGMSQICKIKHIWVLKYWITFRKKQRKREGDTHPWWCYILLLGGFMFFCGERENVDEESLVWFDFVYYYRLKGLRWFLGRERGILLLFGLFALLFFIEFVMVFKDDKGSSSLSLFLSMLGILVLLWFCNFF